MSSVLCHLHYQHLRFLRLPRSVANQIGDREKERERKRQLRGIDEIFDIKQECVIYLLIRETITAAMFFRESVCTKHMQHQILLEVKKEKNVENSLGRITANQNRGKCSYIDRENNLIVIF